MLRLLVCAMHPISLRGCADMRTTLKRFRADESGLTLVESTLIMLILIYAMVNLTEFDRYSRFERHLTAAAESLVAIMGERANPMQDRNWSDDAGALFWLFPEAPLLAGSNWRKTLGVQAALVRFVPTDPSCVSDCASNSAQVVWTWDGGTAESRGLLLVNQVLRACGTLAPGGETPASTTLPSRLFRTGVMIVVTLAYEYQPFSSTAVIGRRPLVREAYAVPRAGDQQITSASNEAQSCS